MTFKQRKIPRELLLDPPPRRFRFWIWILAGAFGIVFMLVAANAWALEPPRVTAGMLMLDSRDSVPVAATHLDTHVDMAITGIISEATVTQRFVNQTADWQEAIYVFPLPPGAAVNFMEMHIGERTINSVIKEKAEARDIYQQATANGQKAALVEQERPNLFMQAVSNIAPNETVEVKIRFLQTVTFDRGAFNLRFPMTLTPRYIPGRRTSNTGSAIRVNRFGWASPSSQVTDADAITPPMYPDGDGGTINPISMNISLDAGFALARIKSLYHDIDVHQAGDRADHRYSIGFHQGTVSMDRDFVLSWAPYSAAAPSAAVFVEHATDGDYALIMLMPPSLERSPRTIPRDMLFVIDISGSMKGTSIEQAKQSLKAALDRLQIDDRFNIVAFNNTHTLLFDESRSADPYYIREARGWVAGLDAGGGTEMLPALEVALGTTSPRGYLKQIVFVTDGAIGNEQALFGLISERLGDARLFTVGIGSAPNSYFMRKAAQFGRGSYTHIGDAREVGEQMTALYDKIENPVVRDIRVTWSGTGVESFPGKLPALYLSEPLTLVAKGNPLPASVLVSGIAGELPWSRELSMPTESRAGPATLWARSKIEALEDEKTAGGDAAKIAAEITEIALARHLVSAYTSLVAVEDIPDRLQEQALSSSPIANAVPVGQSVPAVMFPRTGTESNLAFLAGAAFLLLAAFARLALRPR